MLLEGVPRIPRNTDLRPSTVVAMADSSAANSVYLVMIGDQETLDR